MPSAALSLLFAGLLLFTVQAVGGPAVPLVARVLILLGAGLAAAWSLIRGRLGPRPVVIWMGVLFSQVLLNGISALYAGNGTEARSDVIRQLFIAVWAAALALLLLDSRRRKIWARIHCAVAFALALAIALYYVHVNGLSLLPRDPTRLKATVFLVYGVHFNPLSFAAVLALGIGIAGLRSRRVRIVTGIAVLAPVVLFSSSRTTMISVAFAAMFGAVSGVGDRLKRGVRRALMATVVVLGIIGSVALVYWATEPQLNNTGLSRSVSSVTVSRGFVWAAGVSAFRQAPMFGQGAGTAHDTLRAAARSGLVGQHGIPESGSFHNAYISVLAEKGIFGFVGLVVVVIFLVFRLRALRSMRPTTVTDATLSRVARVWVAALLIRGLTEFGGLFGPADGIVDFLAYSGATLIVAVSCGYRGPSVSLVRPEAASRKLAWTSPQPRELHSV